MAKIYDLRRRPRRENISGSCDVVCHDCRLGLWIGQKTQNSRMKYFQEDIRRLTDFVNDHLDHDLEFGSSERLSRLGYENLLPDGEHEKSSKGGR
jgi:hypothetical protein